MTPFVFLDRERSEVHHGLDNLNTELPLPDPKVKRNKSRGLICPSYRSLLEGVYSGKLSTVWSLEFFIATLFGSAQRVIFEFRVQHTTFQVLIDKIQLYGKMIPNYLQALDS